MRPPLLAEWYPGFDLNRRQVTFASTVTRRRRDLDLGRTDRHLGPRD